MIKKIIMTMIVGFFMTFTAQMALAQNEVIIEVPTIIQTVETKGYHDIVEVIYGESFYTVKAVDTAGNQVILQVDPIKNEIIKVETGPKIEVTAVRVPLSITDAIKKVEAAGYRNVTEVKLEGNIYKIKAQDKDGNKVEVKVDATTGSVTL